MIPLNPLRILPTQGTVSRCRYNAGICATFGDCATSEKSIGPSGVLWHHFVPLINCLVRYALFRLTGIRVSGFYAAQFLCNPIMCEMPAVTGMFGAKVSVGPILCICIALALNLKPLPLPYRYGQRLYGHAALQRGAQSVLSSVGLSPFRPPVSAAGV